MILLHKTHGKHQVTNFVSFCMKYGINQEELSDVLSGVRKAARGWSLYKLSATASSAYVYKSEPSVGAPATSHIQRSTQT